MIAYGFDAVRKSLEQMDGTAPIHGPMVGRIAPAGMRTGRGVVNHVPALNRHMTVNLIQYRGAERE